MDNKEAIAVIRSNWPDLKYSMLIEALEMSIKSLEATESAQTGAQQPQHAIEKSPCASCHNDDCPTGSGCVEYVQWKQRRASAA